MHPFALRPFPRPAPDSRSHQTLSSRFTAMTGCHLANRCLTNPRAPAGTQTHFTFPSKVSLLFSVCTPWSGGDGGGSSRGGGGGGGWASRQTLKVTIPISHQISRTPVITAHSWEVPTQALGISSIWPCDSLKWNARSSTWKCGLHKAGK